jgi:hypothetical protein
VTARAQLLTRADRVRLERERELGELARLMRPPGSLAEPDEPVLLHRQADTKFSAPERRTMS